MNERSNLLSRSKISNDALADVFISIHTNSIKLNNIRGIETYYYPGSIKGKLLASLIQKELIKDTKLNNRGIRSEDFLVLQNVKTTAVLVELGYISNVYEEAILSNNTYQDKFAQAIARAILSYFRK
jgi:N-acetylmuramoyl-L-alanine amidase